jgi:aromatic ring hydroxylase
MLFCNIPFINHQITTNESMNLSKIFQILNRKKEEKLIESYSLSQTTLEQIFVQLAGEDENLSNDQEKNSNESSKSIGCFAFS